MIFSRNKIPEPIKTLARIIRYPQERSKIIREFKIRRHQNQQIKKHDRASTKLIIFLIAGADYETGLDSISGGIISIVSLCEESKKLKEVHGSEVVLCTFPMQHLLARHTKFKNDVDVFRFEQLPNHFNNASQILVHLPEYLVEHFKSLKSQGYFKWFERLDHLHINVLNQNIRLMPSPKVIDGLKKSSSNVTITTAHQQYCTLAIQQIYGVPLHKLSVWISPEKYYFRELKDKENLLVVSPDIHSAKSEILDHISKELGVTIQIIENLTYENYKLLISRAKWTMTFGEGLDGYLIEPIFSGAIGFAVYNSEFFTSDFRSLETLYTSIEELKRRVVSDIRRLDGAESFAEYQKQQYELCARYYSEKTYRENIERFYRNEYTFS